MKLRPLIGSSRTRRSSITCERLASRSWIWPAAALYRHGIGYLPELQRNVELQRLSHGELQISYFLFLEAGHFRPECYRSRAEEPKFV